MAYDEYLADRVNQYLTQEYVEFLEKKMMGGLCFMVDDKMCIGIAHDQLMIRLDPEIYEDCLKKEGCHEMNFTGRPMKGFVFVDLEAVDTREDLGYWLNLALEYNPKAKKSKKRKKALKPEKKK